MNDLNATIGICNLQLIPEILEKNRRNALYLTTTLKVLQSSSLEAPKIEVLEQTEGSAYWLYSVRILNYDKYRFIREMGDRGITVSQVHHRNDHHTCLASYCTDLPNLDLLEQELVCLPVGWWLSELDLDHIVHSIFEIFLDQTSPYR